VRIVHGVCPERAFCDLLPAAGTELEREFNGKAHVVAVAADGFA
jgi:hypothetical protein